MDSVVQRRISDISFVIDKNLQVIEGNRSFLRFLNITEPQINLCDYMEESDYKTFKFYLENYKPNTKNPYFTALIKGKMHSSSCLFSVSPHEKGFLVDAKELSFSRDLMEKALLESREYTTLLQNFDTFYYIYDGKNFVLKNTKDLTTVFTGDADAFRKYFSDNFCIDLLQEDSKTQFDAMIYDSLCFIANKHYKFLRLNKELISVHTHKTSTRQAALILGSIFTGQEHEPDKNSYDEKKDGLTDLYNKKAITEIAVQKINESKNPVSLIVMDIDKFKDCNDTYGHTFGDKVLIAVSKCIKEAINGIGIAGRIGGDEFLIILDKTEESDIRNVARNIRLGIQWSITTADPASIVTCSMGIAKSPENASNYDDLFKIADKCLYIAKDKGRNCYVIYNKEQHDKIITEHNKNAGKVLSGELYQKSAETELAIIQMLSEKKTTQIPEALYKIVKYMQLSKISLYDKNLKLAYIEGIDKLDMRRNYFDEKYFCFFNNCNYLHLDNTNIFSTISRKHYEMYTNNDIASTLEVLIKDGKENVAFVCFDIYKPARTFSKDKLVFALMVAKLLAESIAENTID